MHYFRFSQDLSFFSLILLQISKLEVEYKLQWSTPCICTQMKFWHYSFKLRPSRFLLFKYGTKQKICFFRKDKGLRMILSQHSWFKRGEAFSEGVYEKQPQNMHWAPTHEPRDIHCLKNISLTGYHFPSATLPQIWKVK